MTARGPGASRSCARDPEAECRSPSISCSGGKVPTFQEDALFPFRKGDGQRYNGVHLTTGTVIKLYDYQIGSRFSGGFRGSREALNENLVETILPFRILDFRQTPDPKRGGDRAEGIDPRGFCGMEFLLLRSHREGDNDEDEDEAAGTGRIAVGSIKSPELGDIEISAIRLKRKLPGWLHVSNNRVFHAVNGQVQFKQTRGYLSTTCGFPALKDRVVIVIDASNLTFDAHNEIWKGDREHVRDTTVGERYKDTVTAIIKESKALLDLQNEVALEELQQAVKSERNDLFQKLVELRSQPCRPSHQPRSGHNAPDRRRHRQRHRAGARRVHGQIQPDAAQVRGLCPGQGP